MIDQLWFQAFALAISIVALREALPSRQQPLCKGVRA